MTDSLELDYVKNYLRVDYDEEQESNKRLIVVAVVLVVLVVVVYVKNETN